LKYLLTKKDISFTLILSRGGNDFMVTITRYNHNGHHYYQIMKGGKFIARVDSLAQALVIQRDHTENGICLAFAGNIVKR